MTDMQRAQLLHQVSRLFDVPTEIMESLAAQIKDPSIKDNLTRIARGLTVEENYRHFSMAMPWVKNINGIDQQQSATHKVEYQAPDYSLLVEDSKLERFNVFVDVKAVSGAKESCEVQIKQKHALMNYARDHDTPILLAIYWQRLGYWTHNVIRQLEGKKLNKISWQEAIKNDISHIFGDYTFFVTRPFYRRTTFSKDIKKEGHSAGHEKYGYFDSVLVGADEKTMNEYTVIESSIIDSIFKGREISVIKDGDNTTLTEIFSERPMMIKTSSVLIQFLNTWNVDPSASISDTKVIELGRKCLVNLMQDLGYEASYSIPTSKNSDTDLIFKLAYNNTVVWNRYNASK